ncbi:hypothetical protein FQN54_001656 [Arachnomyces sp. PD_36]|nr:hypothetical protein FQN54_001656 [Arachnomyces sp. PD_36]
MGGGPGSSNRTSPGRNTNGLNGHSGNGQNIGSPLNESPPPYNSNAMSADVFTPQTQLSSPPGNDFFPGLTPIGHVPGTFENQLPPSVRRVETDRPSRAMNGASNGSGAATILIRGLPFSTTLESLRTMLLFAKDLLDADILGNDYTDANNGSSLLTAVARFATLDAAQQARAMLDGKPNSTNEANMSVDVLGSTPPTMNPRRYTIDNTLGGMNPTAGPSHPQVPRNGYFPQNFNGAGDITPSTSNDPFQSNSRLFNIFSSQSGIGNTVNGQRATGKQVIDQDTDEDTGELLKDPIAYAQNGHAGSGMPRRSTNPPVPVNRFANLTVATDGPSQFQRPNVTPMSSTMSPIGNNSAFPFTPRNNYPAANPADQNPPCNTLYVGNLPMDASEDELKALFSKQKGYKRLCFRTKQNGPMCFVEFEDIYFSIRALKSLYGHPLSNSVKGGIRLSFSKNPLGVRNGQQGSMHPTVPMSAAGPSNTAGGIGGTQGPLFSTANGPPPGLQAPPGLGSSMPLGNGSMLAANNPLQSPGATGLGIGPNGMLGNGQLSNGQLSNGQMNGQINGQMTNGQNPNGGPTTPGPSSHNGKFPDYMFGR